jgi:hypothetical protein
MAEEENPAIPRPFMKPDLPLGCLDFKIRGDITNSQCHFILLFVDLA